MVISGRCMPSITLRISGSGHSAPAMTPVRSERQVEPFELRILELGQKHRRHAVERGAPFALDGLQHLARRRSFDRAQAGAVRVGAEHADDAAEAVEQRDAETQTIGGRERRGPRPASSRC